MSNNIIIKNSSLRGEITIPPSKSFAHRAVICASLAKGTSTIAPIDLSSDINATIHGCMALGAEISYNSHTKALTIDGSHTGSTKRTEINCSESGSTLRFMIPVAAALGADASFTGEGRLPGRPIDVYANLLPKHGLNCRYSGSLPFHTSGNLTSGTYCLPGNVSSQFISGLLFALPLCSGNSDIILTTPLESESYVNITIEVLKSFGVSVTTTNGGYHIKGGQTYQPCSYAVEGDWSQAAFFISAGAINSNISIAGLNKASVQGDARCLEIFKSMGADVQFENDTLVCRHNHLNPIELDASDIPDLVPIIAVTAACCNGTSRIYGAGRLRYKESDRLAAISENMHRLGCDVSETDDGLIINSKGEFHGGQIDGFNDHRIVMSFAIAALWASDDIVISDYTAINKSYPGFL